MKKNVIFIAALATLSLLVSGCSVSLSKPLTQDNDLDNVTTGEYDPSKLLVKAEFDNYISELASFDNVKKVSRLIANDYWYCVELNDSSRTVETYRALKETNMFSKIDFDYIMEHDGEVEGVNVSGNPGHGNNTQAYNNSDIFDAWNYCMRNDLPVAGSSDVIVAVIDTGVDYNHIDLRNNIWKNTAEIPNNGIDDDGNGYIDDVYGWDFVGDDNDPMDDNGHGTHVAGIVAAENNNVGAVGVAYNSKVMCLKAGNSSGTFSNSDIAEAINYAYMNGASVINMSFGGSSISTAVNEALERAYNSCVLVASAGNDSSCNQIGCLTCQYKKEIYPACLTYVIGVMSCNDKGTFVSDFSNYDHHPYNKSEYETFACGEKIYSTWPNGKYNTMSGTSMAAPVISGIAAIARSIYGDRNVYSTRFINSQLSNIGKFSCLNKTINVFDDSHPVCSALGVLTKLPGPNIQKVYNAYSFDNLSISHKNNGDSIINSGETIKYALELYNRGGKASDVTLTIDTIRNNDKAICDPYIEILNDTVTMSDIGTYSVGDFGKVYEDDVLVDTEKGFLFKVKDDCPHDYYCSFNLHISYKDGLNNDDKTYTIDTTFEIRVCNGYVLPYVISEDMTFDNSRRYIVAHDVTISKAASVEFKEGCDIEFYAPNVSYNFSPSFVVYGRLEFNGSSEKEIKIKPNEYFSNYPCFFALVNDDSVINFTFCDITNFGSHQSSREVSSSAFHKYNFNNCNLAFYKQEKKESSTYYSEIRNGQVISLQPYVYFGNVYNSYIDLFNHNAVNIQLLESVGNTWHFAANGIATLEFYTWYGYNSEVPADLQIKDNVFFFSNKNENIIDNGDIEIHFNDNSRKDSERNRNVIIDNNLFVSDFNYTDGDNGKYLPSINLKSKHEDSHILFYGSMADCVYSIFSNYLTEKGEPKIDISSAIDNSKIAPYFESISLFDGEEETSTISGENIDVLVEFSTPLDVNKPFSLFYGPSFPYRDYQVKGEFIDIDESNTSKKWKGSFKVQSFIDSGINYFTSSGGVGQNGKQLVDNSGYFKFTIDLTSRLAMNLQAEATIDGVSLSWVQDDYDTLMGYNIYRSDYKNGNYVKLNPSIIPSDVNNFIDDNVEPGKSYWYTFTVVLTDMSESSPAGKVFCTTYDNIKPTVYHVPVNQGYTNNNLVISCTATDNIAVVSGTLYYRSVGELEWKMIPMVKQNDKLTGTIFGSELSIEGLEYYIEISDGNNVVTKGTSDNPYVVAIKDSSVLLVLGDVDGDGEITTKDALLIIKAINNDIILSDDQFKKADLNKDGQLSSAEALRILQYVNGKVSTLEM